MNATLDEQLNAYLKHGGQLEEWQRLTVEVELCRRIESVVQAGLCVLGDLDRQNEAWIQAVRDRRETFYWHRAGEIAHRYSYWKFITSLVLRAVDDCKRVQYAVEGADELRRHFERVSGMALDIELARQSMESDETISHAEAMRAVRARLQTPSA